MQCNQEGFESVKLRSSIYGIFAALLNQPIHEEQVEWIRTLGNAFEAFNPFEDERENENILKGMKLWQDFTQRIKTIPTEQLKEMLGVERTRLFRGIKPGYGPPPPYEAVYCLGGRKEENAFYYAQEGFGLSEQIKEEPDYLGIQLEFMQHLIASEASAWEEGNLVEGERLLSLEREFLRDHLNSWVGKYIDKAYPEATSDFYRGFLSLMKGYLRVDEQYLTSLETDVHFLQNLELDEVKEGLF